MNPNAPHQFVETVEQPEWLDITRFSINGETLTHLRRCIVDGQDAKLWSGGIAEDDNGNPQVCIIVQDGTGIEHSIPSEVWDGPTDQLDEFVLALAKDDPQKLPTRLVSIGRIQLTPLAFNLPA
jgi:hypothetical protein